MLLNLKMNVWDNATLLKSFIFSLFEGSASFKNSWNLGQWRKEECQESQNLMLDDDDKQNVGFPN